MPKVSWVVSSGFCSKCRTLFSIAKISSISWDATKLQTVKRCELFLRHSVGLSPPPFTTGAGNDHWFLNYGTISKFDLAGFLIFFVPSFCVTWSWTWSGPCGYSVHKKSFSDFSDVWYVVKVDDWCTTVWRDTRSRSRLLESHSRSRRQSHMGLIFEVLRPVFCIQILTRKVTDK